MYIPFCKGVPDHSSCQIQRSFKWNPQNQHKMHIIWLKFVVRTKRLHCTMCWHYLNTANFQHGRTPALMQSVIKFFKARGIKLAQLYSRILVHSTDLASYDYHLSWPLKYTERTSFFIKWRDQVDGAWMPSTPAIKFLLLKNQGISATLE